MKICIILIHEIPFVHDIMDKVEKISKGRVKVGPGTLYAMSNLKQLKRNCMVKTKMISKKL